MDLASAIFFQDRSFAVSATCEQASNSQPNSDMRNSLAKKDPFSSAALVTSRAAFKKLEKDLVAKQLNMQADSRTKTRLCFHMQLSMVASHYAL